MITILLHKLELNEKRCLLNKSCSILCPNDGNISLVYGGSFVGYLQRDNCERSLPIVVVLFVVVVVVVLLFNSATDNSKATIFLAIVSKAFGVTHWLHDFLQALSM